MNNKNVPERITSVLFVDDSPESQEAKELCLRFIKEGLRIVNTVPEMNPPRLSNPDGRFLTIEEIRGYFSRFKKGGKPHEE